MSARKWAIVLLIVGLIALFVPFVPQTNSSGQFFGAHYASTATVSPTYYVFHCGSYVNSRITAQLTSGYTGIYDLSKGYTFSCVYTSA
jgi:hypothetical protein